MFWGVLEWVCNLHAHWKTHFQKRGLFFPSLGFEPRSLEFFDLAETGFFAPDLLDYFYSMKDGLLKDVSEDKDTCIQRLFCEFLSHEDPYVQNMASKW